jgi:hypothetical protein
VARRSASTSGSSPSGTFSSTAMPKSIIASSGAC